jgi:hypothetical protein
MGVSFQARKDEACDSGSQNGCDDHPEDDQALRRVHDIKPVI